MERNGYRIDYHWLETCDEVDAFEARHDVKTTPRVWIGAERICG